MPSTMRLPALYDSGESTLDARAFASSATTRLGPSEYGPGSAFGKQADSRAKNQPSFQFSRVDRLADTRPFFGEAYARDMLQAHEAALKPKFQRPPPGAHDAPEPRWSSFGRSGVTHSFGRETLGRERAPAPHHDPYASAAVADVDRLTGASARGANRSTFGRQPTHRDATVFPAARIDKALPREHRATRMQYLGRGFDERQYAGAYSPTGEKFLKTAPVVHSVGPQALSTKRTARSVGFGSSPRVTMIDDMHRMPWTSDDYNRGPGMYQQTADFRQTRRRHRPSAYWTGAREGRRAPKMYPMTSRELRATHKKADAAKLADGTKKRLWA